MITLTDEEIHALDWLLHQQGEDLNTDLQDLARRVWDQVKIERDDEEPAKCRDCDTQHLAFEAHARHYYYPPAA